MTFFLRSVQYDPRYSCQKDDSDAGPYDAIDDDASLDLSCAKSKNMTELIMKLLMPMLILMISHPRYQRCQTRTNRYILETALAITETKKRKHFAIKSTPQNLGKLTSETIFGHSKVVFRPLLRTKLAFSRKAPKY